MNREAARWIARSRSWPSIEANLVASVNGDSDRIGLRIKTVCKMSSSWYGR